jgi:hypothetical protein
MTTATIGYYDIEAAHWDTYVCGALLRPGATAPEFFWHDPSTLLDGMLETPGVEWRAHFGGRYDALLLLTLAARAGWTIRVTTRGASVLRARISRPGSKRADIVLTDTFGLAPVGLAKLSTAAGGVQKGKLDFREVDENPKMQPGSPLGRRLAEYLGADVLALRDGDTAWRQVLREVGGVEPSLTLGSTAWRSALRHLEKCGEDVSEPMRLGQYDAGRAGYYGGRVEVFQTAAPSVYRYDRNSSYPAALTLQPVPVGRRRYSRSWNGEEGTVWARVHVPETRHPPLPVRLKGRLVYPHGTFDGVWSAVELRHAMAHGARIEAIHSARIAAKTSSALRDWCLTVWAARVERPAWNGLLKLFANSLTGKLAQRPERADVAYVPLEKLPKGAELLTAPKDGMAWYRKERLQLSPCARPEWAAYLTAEARCELHRQLEAAGDQSAYCDTDSVYSRAPLARNLGADLGQWKFEGTGDGWHARAPKLYRYASDGKDVVKARGQRGLTAEGYERLTAPRRPGEETPTWTTDAGVESLLSTLSDGEVSFRRQIISRGVRDIDGWCGGRLRTATHETRAPDYSTALAQFGAPTPDDTAAKRERQQRRLERAEKRLTKKV